MRQFYYEQHTYLWKGKILTDSLFKRFFRCILIQVESAVAISSKSHETDLCVEDAYGQVGDDPDDEIQDGLPVLVLVSGRGSVQHRHRTVHHKYKINATIWREREGWFNARTLIEVSLGEGLHDGV